MQVVPDDEEAAMASSDTVLECIGEVHHRLALMPLSLDSESHARMSMKISEKFKKEAKYVVTLCYLSLFMLCCKLCVEIRVFMFELACWEWLIRTPSYHTLRCTLHCTVFHSTAGFITTTTRRSRRNPR